MLNEEIKDTMIRMAMDAMKNAYMEHDSFPVGACVLATDGTLYTGCTIDNVSPRAYCAAEELAIYKAISDGKRSLEAVAVIADTEKPYVPVGNSLQLMAEFEIETLVMANMNGDVDTRKVDEFFPSGEMIRNNHLYYVE